MKNLFCIAITLLSLALYGQQSQIIPSVADRYPGGADTLRKFLAMNLRFPASAVESGHIGLSVASLTISPKGRIENVAIHNTISEAIDKSAADLLYNTDGHWLPTVDYAKNQTFYFQISYVLTGVNDNDPQYVTGDSILDPVIVTAMIYTDTYQTNEDLKRDLKRYMKEGKYANALAVLGEYIRRDPFNIRNYELQANCYEGLGWISMKNEVDERIQRYHHGNPFLLLKDPVLYGNIKIIDPLDNGTYSIKVLNRDSSILYSGKLSSVKPEIRHGKYYFFDSEGSILTTGEYLEDYPVGTWNYYNENGQIERSLDFSKVIKFLLEEEQRSLIDTTIINRKDPLMNENGSFAAAEVMPQFNGKDPFKEFRKYIKEQMIYPIFPEIKGLEGTIIVQFTVDKEGSVREPIVIRGAHIDLNMEALRIIINSPKWTPGSIDGKNVNVVFTYPVTFRLGNELDLMDFFY